MTVSRNKRKVPLLLGVTFRFALIVAALCLFVSYLSSYVNPAKFSLPLFFGLYFIPILAINIILFLIAAILRSKSAWITVIALLPSLLYAERFVKIGKESSSQKTHTIRIQTYNVGNFQLPKDNMSLKDNMEAIFRQISKEDADIVCLQEVFLDNPSMVSEILPQYKWRTYHMFRQAGTKHFGNIILSKKEIINGKIIRFKHSTNMSQYADIVLGRDTVRIYNNHLESYAISLTTLVKRLREKRKNSEEVSSEIINVHTKVKNTVIRRSRQVSNILSSIKESPYPTIICGDFNDTPMSYTYHKLSGGSKDTFKEAGKGFSATYSMLWPLFRIDYIFVPNSYNVSSHKTIKCNYSDHYPVVAVFEIPKKH